eukprot:TRINITY_DN13798_c0_g1_i1.p1 TRINITY_DN13798_c0_g1~~TRINITY_DN13798_c0_g1_i1.p1  ORF type:complete len:195 (-),score=40.86 TRINITY_DN13798_c0_g1_i1:8-592(-)
MEIPDTVRGLIFDCDGTLADTMPQHYTAWQQSLQAQGCHFPEDLFYATAGMPSAAIIQLLNEKFGWSIEPVATIIDKEERYLKLLPSVTEIEHVASVARHYYGKLPMSVGSGNFRAHVIATLKAAKLDHLFDIVVGADDVLKGKPAPDTWLLCAQKMGVEPQLCHVFEDGNFGLQAAAAAGMSATDIRLHYPKK